MVKLEVYLRQMNISRWIHWVSVFWGIFALYSASQAFNNILLFPRSIGIEILRFGVVAIVAAIGLVMLLPHRWLPIFCKLAERITPAPVRVLCGLVWLLCLIVSVPTGAIALWIGIPLSLAFVFAFFVPGIAFRNVNVLPQDEFSMEDLGKLVSDDLRRRSPLQRALVPLSIGMIFVGLVGYIFGPQTIPSPQWAALCDWLAVILAATFTAILLFPWFALTPPPARSALLPSLVVLAVFLFPTSIVTNQTLFLRLVPSGAASLWGEDTALTATFIRQTKNQKLCKRPIQIRIETDEHKLCNFRSDFLSELLRDDQVIVLGKSTWFGQHVQGLRIPK
jgi:hypothetical protein